MNDAEIDALIEEALGHPRCASGILNSDELRAVAKWVAVRAQEMLLEEIRADRDALAEEYRRSEAWIPMFARLFRNDDGKWSASRQKFLRLLGEAKAMVDSLPESQREAIRKYLEELR